MSDAMILAALDQQALVDELSPPVEFERAAPRFSALARPESDAGPIWLVSPVRSRLVRKLRDVLPDRTKRQLPRPQARSARTGPWRGHSS